MPHEAHEYDPIIIDPVKMTDSYLGKSSWRVKENSTSNYSIGGLILAQSGAVSSAYWLDKVLPEAAANAHKNADLHVHDLCFEKDAKFMLADGTEMSFREAEEKGITEADVISYDEKTKTFVTKHATNIGERAEPSELLEIELEDGTILPACTPYHKFLTQRGWVEAKDLKDSDELVEYN